MGNSVVKDILSNILYTGYLKYEPWGISLREAKHQPLISMGVHEKIQKRLLEKAQVPVRKDLASDFPLRGFIVCAECDGSLTAAWSTGRRKKYPYYECHKKVCPSYRKAIPRDELEQEFVEQLTDLQPGDDVVAASKAILRDLWEDQQKRKKSRQQKFRSEIAASEKQVSGLLDRILETENPAVMGAYEKRIADLEKTAAVMREKLTELGKQKLTFDDMFEHTIDVLSKPNEIWKEGIFTGKR